MSDKFLDDPDEMKDEYDFTYAIRNPYAKLARGGLLVKLDPDVSRAFPTSEAVNEALRLLMKTAEALLRAS